MASRLSLLQLLVVFLLAIGACTDPDTRDPHYKRAMEWLDLKNYSAARQEFLRAIESGPKNVAARYQMARAYYLEGDLVQASQWCAETFAVDPRHRATKELVQELTSKAIERTAATDSQSQYQGLAAIDDLSDRNLIEARSLLQGTVLPVTMIPDQQGGEWGQVLLRQAKPGKGGRDDIVAVTRKLFVVNLAGTQSCPAKGGRQPEASLAWWWGDPSCEA